MKPTENQPDEIPESKDQSKLALVTIGLMCIIGVIVAVVSRPGPTFTMYVEMPEPPPIQNSVSRVEDSTFVIYTLKNDSVALFTMDALLFTTLSAAFADTALVSKMEEDIVLIKRAPGSDQKTLTNVVDKVNENGLEYSMKRYYEGELDTLKKSYLP
jgi:hypothetical protein